MKNTYPSIVLIIACFLSLNAFAVKEDSLLNAIANSNDDDKKIEIFNHLSNQFLRSDTIKALQYAQSAFILAEKNNNIKGQISSSESLARYYTEQGNYVIAKSYLINTLNLYSDSEYDKEIAAVCISLANIHDILSEFDLALTYYLKAEKSFEKIDNKRGMGLAQMGIANVYSTTKFYEEAIKYYKRSSQNLINNDEKFASWSINNMAIAMMEINQNDSALFYFEKSLEIKLRLEDYYGASYTYSDMGTLFYKLNQHKKALESYQKALEIKKTLEGINPETLGSTYNKIGLQLILLGKYNEAIANLEKGIIYSQKSGSLQYLKEAHKNMAEAYFGLRNFEKAYVHIEKYAQLSDSLSNKLNSESLAELKMVYETAQKDKDIELLNNSVALQQKTMKLQELEVEESHRKNQMISIFLGGALLVIVLVVGLGWVLYKANINKKKTNVILEKTNQEITHQKHIIEEKHREITDSINYAERIQRSFLATKELLDENLKDYFVFFQPKDIVSGDFYWAGKLDNGYFAIVNADSTGHGVPGAIMSILNISSIEKAVDKGLVEPHEIFNDTRRTIIERLKKDGSAEGGKDGMDASLISINPEKTKMSYVAAQNPIWIIRHEEFIEIKPEKMPVGKHEKDKEPFDGGAVDLQKGDLIYTITDGFQDQFGGEKGKKFMVKKMREYLQSIASLSMQEQHQKLNEVFTSWKGEHEQVDDVCIIGVRI